MDNKTDIVSVISNLLDAEKYKEALNLPNDEKCVKWFKDNCWDLISVIIDKIKDDTIILKPSLHNTCEELLSLIVQKATPEEALLEFIEQIELAKNDAQFSIILQPLQQLLKKLSHKRTRSLEWCLNSISTYIETIPLPDCQLEGEERLLMDCDDDIRRINKVCSILIPFYKPFIEELNQGDRNTKTKQIITAFLISLQGKPFIYLDLEPESNASGEARQCCYEMLQDICILEKDVNKFLVFVENFNKNKSKSQSKDVDCENEKSPYEHEEKINMTTLSGFYYCVHSGHFDIPEYAIPQVYSTEYIVHTGMLCVIHLLSFSEYSPLMKGIALCYSLFNRFSNNISHTFLSLPVHFELCKSLMNVTLNSNYTLVRKKTVNLIGCHIKKFEFKGRCILIKYILETANHPGLMGYAVTSYKNSIDEAFKSPLLPDCFTGAQFLSMLRKVWHLPQGVETDLVELSDQILSVLNCLRYLILKDTENKTGIKDHLSIIESEYLDPLRTGLKLSKAHYEVKLLDVDKSENVEPQISINVAGSTLGNIPKEKKKEILLAALNCFHLMEGLVARLTECINMSQ